MVTLGSGRGRPMHAMQNARGHLSASGRLAGWRVSHSVHRPRRRVSALHGVMWRSPLRTPLLRRSRAARTPVATGSASGKLCSSVVRSARAYPLSIVGLRARRGAPAPPPARHTPRCGCGARRACGLRLRLRRRAHPAARWAYAGGHITPFAPATRARRARAGRLRSPASITGWRARLTPPASGGALGPLAPLALTTRHNSHSKNNHKSKYKGRLTPPLFHLQHSPDPYPRRVRWSAKVARQRTHAVPNRCLQLTD